MKRIVLLLAIAVGVRSWVVAQASLPVDYKMKTISPIKMDISMDMTTNIIFPFQIKSVDRGSADILAQKARGADNVLQVKAAKEQFRQSNLSVITSDGQLYSFLLDYAPTPSFLNLSFYRDSSAAPVQLAGVDITADVIEKTAQEACAREFFMWRRTKDQKMNLRLGTLYYDKAYLWFCFSIRNSSMVAYEPEYLKFFIKDRKQARRTAVQLKELIPVYCLTPGSVTSDQPAKVVVGIPAFTLSKKQELRILLKEKNGGRDLELVIRHGTLLRARLL
ncbi:conjugative transposon protein TraN [Paraflavitalea pollutisoli]|uniref:conjugative transposon protein TraN n=1 Tax=Paraflavitalea pollutisoli TaxID=3034143 RepID=UPI0023EBA1E5|nr:conjugative transposon protein TraN [Paraflavitalea sp. H1-2-19X]